MKSYRVLSAVLATTTAISVGLLVVQHVRAAGAPTTGMLTYTGFLEQPDGTPVSGPTPIALAVYDVATGGKPIAKCAVPAVVTEVVRGRFQIPLPDTCADVTHENPALWIDIQVESVSLGRTRFGAVPYALEAQRAVEAQRARGSLAVMAAASPTDACVTIKNTAAWTDVPGNVVEFSVDAPAQLLATFSMNVQPDGASGSDFVSARLLLDGAPLSGGVDHFQPYTAYDANVALHALAVADLAAGKHVLKLQWNTVGSAVTWSSCTWTQATGDIAARTLVAQAFYK